ncbi:PAS domain-containing protein [Sulfurirhabdus autotrophica]|nr:PAS domain-containing protein [Sulfurirhabdus autotrophica]
MTNKMAEHIHSIKTSKKQSLKVIGVGFAIVMLLMIFLVIFSLSRLHINNQQLEKIVTGHNVKAAFAYKMQFIARERIILLQAIINTVDVFDRDVLIERFHALAPKFLEAMNAELKQDMVEEEKALIDLQRKHMSTAAPIQEEVLLLALDGETDKSVSLLLNKAVPAQDKTLDVLGQFINLQFEQASQVAASAKQSYQDAVYLLTVSGLVALVLSIFIALFVNRKMSGLMTSLRGKEQEARILLDNIPDLVWLKDCESHYVWANPQFELASALEPGKVTGLSDREVWQASEAVLCQSDDRKAMESHTTIQSEYALTNHAGKSRQFATSRTPIYDEAGQCKGVLGVAYDITERNQLIEKIRDAGIELQFQKTALDQHAIVSIADVRGNIIYVNDKFCEISKYGRDELLGKNHRVLKSGFHPPAFFHEMWATITEGHTWQGEVCNRAKGDGLYWVKTTIVPFLDENGLPLRYVSIRTDITQVKAAEQLLQRSQEELEKVVQERTSELMEAKHALEADVQVRQQTEAALSEQLHFTRELMEVLPNPLFYKGVDGIYIGVNKAWETFFGRNRLDVIGKTVSDLYAVQPEVAQKHLEMDRQLFEHEGSQSYEISMEGPDGNIRHAVYYKATYTKFDGGLAGLVGTIVDVSERKIAEANIRQRNLELNELNQKLQETQNQLLQSEKMASVGQLAAGVAHEINNPIGYVYSNLGTLDKYVKDMFSMLEVYEQVEPGIADAEALARLQIAKQKYELEFLKQDVSELMNESKDGISRVKKIVQDLKDFSHVDVSEEWHWADLIKGINSTLNIVSNEIKYKAEVIKEYSDIPEVECLSSQVNQVFMNLLVNAAHAIEERGVITIRTGMQGDEVWVEISDTGKGIAPENLKRIFDPFFTTKPIGKGTGLGLSLSYGIIQKHHGRIEVQSEVDKGTTFRVCLPLSRQDFDDQGNTHTGQLSTH